MSTLTIGDRVEFLGIDAEAQDRKEQEITGSEGAWSQLKAGTIGTVLWVEPDDLVTADERDNPRLFVTFDGTPCATDTISALLGMPTGWPVLTSEVKKADAEAA